jgi:hypothetical protein
MTAAHVELNAAGQLDDGLGMMAVLEESVLDGLGPVDEQAAEQPILFLGDPLAAAVAAYEDDGGGTNTRWRFDELHVGIPFQCGAATFREALTSGESISCLAMVGRVFRRKAA